MLHSGRARATLVRRRPKEEFCTLIGGMTGVTVHLSAADAHGADRATACVEGRCNKLRNEVVGVLMPVRASGPRVVQIVFVLERDGETG